MTKQTKSTVSHSRQQRTSSLSPSRHCTLCDTADTVCCDNVCCLAHGLGPDPPLGPYGAGPHGPRPYGLGLSGLPLALMGQALMDRAFVGWALMGPPGPSWAGPSWPLWAGPLWTLGPYMQGPHCPPGRLPRLWDLCRCICRYSAEYPQYPLATLE